MCEATAQKALEKCLDAHRNDNPAWQGHFWEVVTALTPVMQRRLDESMPWADYEDAMTRMWLRLFEQGHFAPSRFRDRCCDALTTRPLIAYFLRGMTHSRPKKRRHESQWPVGFEPASPDEEFPASSLEEKPLHPKWHLHCLMQAAFSVYQRETSRARSAGDNEGGDPPLTDSTPLSPAERRFTVFMIHRFGRVAYPSMATWLGTSAGTIRSDLCRFMRGIEWYLMQHSPETWRMFFRGTQRTPDTGGEKGGQA